MEGGDLLFAEGYDDAIVGIAERDGVDVVAYDADAIVAILRKRDGMTRDEAEEFFDYNIGGAFLGERTPIFVFRARA